MKVLCLIDNLGSGGAQRQMVTLAGMMKNEGLDVSFLIYCNKDDFFKKDLQDNNIPIHYCLTSNSFVRIYKVRRFIRSKDFDTVISFMDAPNFLACVSAIGGKRWHLITNELSSMTSTFLTLRGKLFGWFQRYSDAIVCNSHNAERMWQKFFPIYTNKISVIYNPVILPKITSHYIPRKDGKLNVVIAASYQYLKNPIGLINALAMLSEEERKLIKVTWYGRKEVTKGDTFAFDEALMMISEFELQNVIFLNDPIHDIAEKMYEADIVALFSELEGLPNVICEGMMIGKPIIMSRMSDFEVLVDHSNGFLCNWDNSLTIKNSLISAMCLSETQLIEMGKVSKIKAEILFSPEVILKQWMNLIIY